MDFCHITKFYTDFTNNTQQILHTFVTMRLLNNSRIKERKYNCMDFFGVLNMIGGLALFLYGMKIMGDSLSKLAGGKMEQVLEQMTSNPLKAVLLGAGVTAVIQSSSATTVMVVGFVNSGIMRLSQAAPVIMGANIGTTVTSWLLSLTGIESGNFWVQLLKPTSFTPILAVIGVILVMFLKDTRKNDIGTILLGFAILMFGMEAMSGAVKPLADVPEFTSLFTAFENPILGMIVGAVLTAIIQSSSASVGILQAMCVTGSVSVGAALPVIMGQNIGTCITAVISSMGANRNAKRASLIHLYFNLIGTTCFMVVFYSVNAFVHFEFLSDTASAASIAVIHSVFNVLATAVLLPLAKMLEKLAYATLPVTEEEKKAEKGRNEKNFLDERFLESPAFAVAQCKSAVCEISKLVEEGMALVVKSATVYNEKEIERVCEIENLVDEKQDEISSYLNKLSAKPLTEKDSCIVGKLGRCVVDFERISDYLKGISYALRAMHERGDVFSESASKEKELIFNAAFEIVENTSASFIHGDKDMALKIDPLYETITGMKDIIRKNHGKRLEKGSCSVELGLSLTDMVTSIARIAGHCSNIAEAEISDATDEFALHSYVRSMRENNEYYREQVQQYKSKYAIVEK